MCARARKAPPSSMPTALFPTANARARPKTATNRKPFRSSSASRSSTPTNARFRRNLAPPPPAPVNDNLILPQAEALIRATGADIRIGGSRAFYVPSADFIQVPPPSAYFEPVNWHRTVCHELGHWTGHESRLNRDFSGGFGSSPYAREELVAEMTGAFVCAALSIVPTVRHADYLANWLEVLREDNRAIIRAASAASKAADYLLAFRASDPAPEIAAHALAA